MSKTFKWIYTVIFFILCCLPLALMSFVKSNEQIEKKALTDMPAYLKDGRLNLEFSDQFESWLNDRMPLRSQLLTSANFLKGELMHVPSSNVIVGKDGWLFYNSESADFMNTNAMTDEQVAQVAVTLSLMEEKITSAGGHFTFVPMPNKSSVYGEYMPVFFPEGETHNIDRIQEALKEAGVTYVDMKSVMTENKDLGLYHRRDSHWNYQGALLGYNAIMDSLGRPHETYADASYTIEKSWRGDLDKLLYPAGGTLDDQYVYDIDFKDFVFVKPAAVRDTQEMLLNFMSDKEQGDDLFTTENREISDGSRLYIARDSFGRALLPYLIDNYQTATFKRTDCPDIASLEPGTDVVYEIAERNLSRVISTAPFMYAPRRDASVLPSAQTQGGTVEPVFENAGYAWRLYGSLPELASEAASAAAEESASGAMDPAAARVYLVLSKDGSAEIFEAFPIYESKYLKDGGNRGYSAYLSKEEGLSGSYQLQIVIGGTAYDAGTVNFE